MTLALATAATAAVATRAAIATRAVATTTIAATTSVASNRLLLSAHQGDTNDREQNRDTQNQSTIHPRILHS